MVGPEPKKEALRIIIPPQPTAPPAKAPSGKRDTMRINLPTRPPASSSTNPPESVPKADAPAPRPPLPPQVTLRPGVSHAAPSAGTGLGAAGTMPLTVTPPTNAGSPKEDTARITALRDPPSRSGGQMNKMQPLIDMPAAGAPEAPLTVVPERRMAINQIPKPLCWTFLGVSATILIIQIWSYFS